MAFENLTMFELHLDLGDDEAAEPAPRRPDPEPVASRGGGVKRTLFVALLLTTVSVAVSVGVTLAVRRYRNRGEDETGE